MGRLTLSHRFLDRTPGRLQTGQRKEAHRQERHLAGLLDGTLRSWVESAERLNGVTEKLHAQGLRLQGREHIDDPPAHAHLAFFLDQGHAAVAPLD